MGELRISMFQINFVPLIIVLFSFFSAVEWITPVEFDFGKVAKGRPVSHTFTFTNRGETPLLIETARTTCGCTVPSWSQTPILPDSSGQITVTYDAQKKGAFRKTVKVYFYQIRGAERLSVKGYVE